jgi:hypothetical protein
MMTKNYAKRVVQGARGAAFASLTLLSLTLSSAQAGAQENAATILKQMSDYLAGQKAIKVSFDSSIDVLTDNLEKIQFNSSGELLLERPNKLKVVRTGGYSNVEMTFDGTTATLFGKNANIFARLETPGTTDQLLDRLRTDYELIMPGADLLLSDVFAALSQDVVESKLIGTGVIGGVDCDHIAFRNDNTDWQLWIEVGNHPVPRKLVITSKAVTGAPQYTLLLNRWQTEPPIPPASFVFTPPEGAKELDLKDIAALPELDEVPAGIVSGAKQ